MTGEIERYQVFLRSVPADAILINAAQQWTFDAAWPVLDAIRAKKVLIPCGFSGLYLPQYRSYFEEIPNILGKFDRLIFHAESYRDIDFARQQGLTRSPSFRTVQARKSFQWHQILASSLRLEFPTATSSFSPSVRRSPPRGMRNLPRRLRSYPRKDARHVDFEWRLAAQIVRWRQASKKDRLRPKECGRRPIRSLDVRRASPRDYIRRARGLWGQGGAKLTMRRIARFLLRWGLLRQRTMTTGSRPQRRSQAKGS